jgi:hypothetical protein
MSVLAPPVFLPGALPAAAESLKTGDWLTIGQTLKVALPTTRKSELWVDGQVVRVRELKHGFFEAGIEFRGRL